MSPAERHDWARRVTAVEAERQRRADLWVELAVLAGCAGVIAGYLICKLAG